MNVKNAKWVERHLQVASLVSQWSKDPHTKVGAIIVTESGKPKSWGFNGIPMKVEDHPDRFERPQKYNFFAHAERNAIDLCDSNLENCVLFCTHTPCSSCAGSIVNNQLKAVFVDSNNGFLRNSFVQRDANSFQCHSYSLEMFTEADIQYNEYCFNSGAIYNITKRKGKKLYVRKIFTGK